MRRRDFTWTIAFCGSLAAHAAFIEWRLDRYILDYSPVRLAPLSNDPFTLAVKSVHEADELGDSHGKGYAADASPGEVELRALKGDQDQSFLSRDPQGPGTIGAVPSQSTSLPGDNGENGAMRQLRQEAAVAPQPAADPTPQAFGVQSSATPSQPKFADLIALGPHRQPPAEIEKPAPPKPPEPQPVVLAQATPQQTSAQQAMQHPMTQQQQAAVQPTMAAVSARPGRPGPHVQPADPAPQAETESDPFAIVGSMEFRPGATTVRVGRKHKLTRPKLSWDTQYDFFGMTHSTIVLDLKLDDTGQVVNATVARSSGSDSVDQACRIAAYEWWFEPAKNAAGQSVRDEIKFTIKFM